MALWSASSLNYIKLLIPLAGPMCRKKALYSSKEHLLRETQSYDSDFFDAFISTGPMGEVQYALLFHPSYLMVIFPSSRGTEDWSLTGGGNLNALVMKEAMGGWLHRGFWNHVDTYWHDLSNRIWQYLNTYNGSRVVFTGHSRGGACAVVCAMRFNSDERLWGVITFGQPKVMGQTHASDLGQRWGERYIRVVNSSDIIPTLPPSPRYQHFGVMLFCDEDCNILENPSGSEINEAIMRDNPIGNGSGDDVMDWLAQAYQSFRAHKLSYYGGQRT